MTSMRRSRCVYVAALTALIYMIVFCVISYDNMTNQLFSARLREFTLDSAGLRYLFESLDSYSFDAWADAIFRRKVEAFPTEPALRMAKYDIDGPAENSCVIELPAFIRGEGENPHLSPLEPRLTLGVVLSEMNARLSTQNSEHILEVPSFHWADWTDLALLEHKMLSVDDSASLCKSLNPARKERNALQNDIAHDARKYCFDDADLALLMKKHARDPSVAPYLHRIAEQPYKTGLHVFGFPNRTSQRVRTLAAASYLHDFMPAPMAVHFLVPRGGHALAPLHVPVSQDVSNRVRIVDSQMARAAAERAPRIDLRSELDALASRMGSSATAPLKYQKEIGHEAFVDTLAELAKELSQQAYLSPQESMYLGSLRHSLGTKSPSKYFNEAQLVRNEGRDWSAGSHYDWRFFKGLKADRAEHALLLHGLILAWLRFTNANEINTWIAHGSLLGWYWNGLSFPWDADYDVQVPIMDLHSLARRFNQTVVVDFGTDSEVRLGRYFLDCGTWVSHRDKGNGLNNIDARFIDMDSGLYVDITGLAVSLTATPKRYYDQIPKELRKNNFVQKAVPNPELALEVNAAARLYNCRNKHFMSLPEISPLRLTLMEGVPAYIPNNFTNILQTEYRQGIDSKKFKSFAFLPRLRLWADAKDIQKYTRGRSSLRKQLQMGNHAKIAQETVDKLSVFSLSDEDYLELMTSEENMLLEYLVSKNTTAFHQKEMNLLLEGLSTEKLLFNGSELMAPQAQLRHDISNYNAVRDQRGYAEKMQEYVLMAEAFRAGKSYKAKKIVSGTEPTEKLGQETKQKDSTKKLQDESKGRSRPGLPLLQSQEESENDTRTRPNRDRSMFGA